MFRRIRYASRSALFIFGIIGIIVVGSALFAYSWQTIDQLRKEARRSSSTYAFVMSIIYSASMLFDTPSAQDDARMRIISNLQEDAGKLQENMSFPSIFLIDPNSDLPEEASTASQSIRENLPTDKTARLQMLKSIAAEMDEQNEPIPIVWYYYDEMTGSSKQAVIATFHYGDPPIVGILQWIPLGQMALILAFALIGILAYRRMRHREQHAIWVGMAKETAHQLSTPISSLMGWLTLSEERQLRPQETEEFNKDIERLHKIATRFGKIGMDAKLQSGDLVQVVRNAFDYCQRRLPAAVQGLEMKLDVPTSLQAYFAPDLYEWVVENLIKNAAQALPEGKGYVCVSLSHTDTHAFLMVEDNGRGITKRELGRIFVPGYSTRQGGWGLGLTLVKRIIEEYHHGEINVSSEVGKGTRFTAQIPFNPTT